MERYERIATYTPFVAICDAPVFIEKGALLWDSVRKATVIQFRLKNVSAQMVRSVYISYHIKTSDHTEANAELFEFGYVGVNCAPGVCFGDNFPIVIASDTVQSVDARVTRIVYTDNSVVDIPFYSYVNWNEEDTLPYANEKVELYKQFCGTKTDNLRVPVQKGDSVQCVCGYMTAKDTCPQCGANIQTALYLSDAKNLEDQITRREAEEARRQAEIQEQKTKEKAQATAKRRKKVRMTGIVVASIIVLCCSALVIRTAIITAPAKRQDKAVTELLELYDKQGADAVYQKIQPQLKIWLDENTDSSDVDEFRNLEYEYPNILGPQRHKEFQEFAIFGQQRYEVLQDFVYGKGFIYEGTEYHLIEGHYISELFWMNKYRPIINYNFLMFNTYNEHEAQNRLASLEDCLTDEWLYIRNNQTSVLVPLDTGDDKYSKYTQSIDYFICGVEKTKVYISSTSLQDSALNILVYDCELGTLNRISFNKDEIPLELFDLNDYVATNIVNWAITNTWDANLSNSEFSSVVPRIAGDTVYLRVIVNYEPSSDEQSEGFQQMYLISREIGGTDWSIHDTIFTGELLPTIVIEDYSGKYQFKVGENSSALSIELPVAAGSNDVEGVYKWGDLYVIEGKSLIDESEMYIIRHRNGLPSCAVRLKVWGEITNGNSLYLILRGSLKHIE